MSRDLAGPPSGPDSGRDRARDEVDGVAGDPGRGSHDALASGSHAGSHDAVADDPGAGSHDEVDRLVAAWRRERPDLDVTPLEVLSRVTRLARHLDLARRAAFAEHDLEGWEFDVLTALRRNGAPYALSPGQLVTQTLVTSGTMTNRIDRLVAKGLVERLPDPRDRRGVQVLLTPAGRALVDSAMADLLHREHALLGGLADDEQHALAATLRQLLLPFDSA